MTFEMIWALDVVLEIPDLSRAHKLKAGEIMIAHWLQFSHPHTCFSGPLESASIDDLAPVKPGTLRRRLGRCWVRAVRTRAGAGG